jgi:hypothetical protein
MCCHPLLTHDSLLQDKVEEMHDTYITATQQIAAATGESDRCGGVDG